MQQRATIVIELPRLQNLANRLDDSDAMESLRLVYHAMLPLMHWNAGGMRDVLAICVRDGPTSCSFVKAESFGSGGHDAQKAHSERGWWVMSVQLLDPDDPNERALKCLDAYVLDFVGEGPELKSILRQVFEHLRVFAAIPSALSMSIGQR